MTTRKADVELIPLSVAAAAARVTWRVAWNEVLLGALPAVRVNNRWYVERTALTAWIDRRASAPVSAAAINPEA